MSLGKIIEIIFTIVMLLFLAVFVLGILVGISVLHELDAMGVEQNYRTLFLGGMALSFFWIMKMIIDRIREFNRFA
jgi:hypothetical protein